MDTSDFDVVVIGAGAMGSAAAYYLARAGQRVLLLEQFAFGHARGSSHGESRIFRFAYLEPDYARLAMQSLPLWRELEAEAGEVLLHSTGGLDLADDAAGHAEVQQIARNLSELGCQSELLDAGQLARRFPQWRLSATAMGVYSPDAGVLHAGRSVATLQARARAHGAVLRDEEPALHVEPEPKTDAVVVATARGRYRARRVVITAGAWAQGLLRPLGIELPLQVTQEQVVYFRPRARPESFAPPHFPIWIHRNLWAYGLPAIEKPAIKVAFHHSGPVVDPATCGQAPRPEMTERLRAYLERHLPDAAGPPVEALTCLYTNTPDEDFIVDALPAFPSILLGSPCSGHGFKFAVGVGRALADLALAGRTEISIQRCGLSRFLAA